MNGHRLRSEDGALGTHGYWELNSGPVLWNDSKHPLPTEPTLLPRLLGVPWLCMQVLRSCCRSLCCASSLASSPAHITPSLFMSKLSPPCSSVPKTHGPVLSALVLLGCTHTYMAGFPSFLLQALQGTLPSLTATALP